VAAITNGSTASSGGVDLCTRSGVTGGPLVEGFVAEGTPAPAGSCSSANADCGSPDLFCSTAAPVSQCTCSGGLDTCVSYGQCRTTPCASCNMCLDSMQPYLRQVDTLPAMSDTAAASEVALRFEKFCNDSSSDIAVCRKVSDYVKSAFRGYPGRRAGSVCNMLGRCSSVLNATCRLQPSGVAVNGSLDLCTFEGVAGGRQLADITLSTGEFVCLSVASASWQSASSSPHPLLPALSVQPVTVMKSIAGVQPCSACWGRRTHNNCAFCLLLQAYQKASARRTPTATPPQSATSAVQARSAAATEAWTSAKQWANASPCHPHGKPRPASAAAAASPACKQPSAAASPQTPA
jgi:hypothetical protein